MCTQPGTQKSPSKRQSLLGVLLTRPSLQQILAWYAGLCCVLPHATLLLFAVVSTTSMTLLE